MPYLWTAMGPVRLKQKEARVKPLLSPRDASARPVRPASAPKRRPMSAGRGIGKYAVAPSTSPRASPPRPMSARSPRADDEAPPAARRRLRSERKAARQAQRASMNRLTKVGSKAGVAGEAVDDFEASRGQGNAWDYSLARYVFADVPAPRAEPDAPPSAADEPQRWAVYITRDAHARALVDLGGRTAERLTIKRRGGDASCVVLDNVRSPPNPTCAACVAVDCGAGNLCDLHGRCPPCDDEPRGRGPASPGVDARGADVPRGSYDVFAVRLRASPSCVPPCPECGAPGGHPTAADALAASAPPPRLYRLGSRFANGGRAPTPGAVAKKLRRYARVERARDRAHAPPDARAGDVTTALELANVASLDRFGRAVTRDAVAAAAALRVRGPCPLATLRRAQSGALEAARELLGDAPAPAPAEAPPPAEARAAADLAEGPAPPSASTRAEAFLEFADLRARLRAEVELHLDGVGSPSTLRSLVAAWRASNFSLSDHVLVEAADHVARATVYDGSVPVEATAEAFALGTPPRPARDRPEPPKPQSPGSVVFLL